MDFIFIFQGKTIENGHSWKALDLSLQAGKGREVENQEYQKGTNFTFKKGGNKQKDKRKTLTWASYGTVIQVLPPRWDIWRPDSCKSCSLICLLIFIRHLYCSDEWLGMD